ncbi:hypothetical protein E2C01_080286 [Portunus trituberculatus]|uniref:Uncharacterized protein n=1 Tax=Portunus trituberculatus TaxID=210409 RepID=A0A5B7IVM7_PORTR|nr:hypothetical protein [Portunus trituberculatus]
MHSTQSSVLCCPVGCACEICQPRLQCPVKAYEFLSGVHELSFPGTTMHGGRFQGWWLPGGGHTSPDSGRGYLCVHVLFCFPRRRRLSRHRLLEEEEEEEEVVVVVVEDIKDSCLREVNSGFLSSNWLSFPSFLFSSFSDSLLSLLWT